MARVYLAGIGGISMSGIAKYELKKGNQVFGSDIKENEEIRELKRMGATIYLEQKKENILNNLPLDLVVYTSAISEGSPGFLELEAARQNGIKTIKRSEYLGELSKIYPTIAISGMHGKTTATSMLGFVLKKMGKNPLVFVGAETNCFDYSNVEIPKKNPQFLVLEACEYDGSFLDFNFDAAIILNIEAEHLDYFKGGLAEIIKTFHNFSLLGKENSFIVALDEPIVRQALNSIREEVISYGPKELESENIKLKVLGGHNRLNALAVLKVIERLGLNIEEAKKILEIFPGAKRRLEYKGKMGENLIYDDYAHHPTEIEASLKALREKYPQKSIFLVFGPHQYSRTTLLFADFVRTLGEADKLCLLEVFGVMGREKIENPKTSRDLFSALEGKVKDIFYAQNLQEAEEIIKKNKQKNDIIVCMGAGETDQLANKLIDNG